MWRKKLWEGSGEGARWAPPLKIFEKSNLKPFILVHIWSNYLKWLTKWFNCHFHEKSLVIIWCDGIIKFCWRKSDRESGDEVPQKQKLFSYLSTDSWICEFHYSKNLPVICITKCEKNLSIVWGAMAPCDPWIRHCLLCCWSSQFIFHNLNRGSNTFGFKRLSCEWK